MYPEVMFVERIVEAITGDPGCYDVTRSIDERGVLLCLTVEQSQLGRVIGKQGQTANAIRSLLRALGLKHDARYSLKIVQAE